MVAMNIVRIYELFPTESDCITHLENVRWKGKPVCPYCGSDRATSAPAVQRYHCNNCKTSFSVTVGTIFHHTHLLFQKWLLAVSIVLNAKKGLSARQLARDLEVNKNTGWRMGMQIRKAMAEREQRELLSGVVQMDEIHRRKTAQEQHRIKRTGWRQQVAARTRHNKDSGSRNVGAWRSGQDQDS
jgi:transposase-like protein